MLYKSTRDHRDAFTANHALTKDRAGDGGVFGPHFTKDELGEIAAKPFNHRIAQLLNLLFGTKLTQWDVDFAVGRRPVRLAALNHRCILGECWHNPEWNFKKLAADLSKLVKKSSTDEEVSDWTMVGVRIAVLFGIFGELDADTPVDVAVASGDLSGVMAARYARGWGLPIGNIIICCNENANLWELLNRGELRTGQPVISTATPDCDQILTGSLERFIYDCGGEAEVIKFLDAVSHSGIYTPSDLTLQNMRRGTIVSVVGQKRIASAIPNLYQTTHKLLGPYAALAYCGLLDYRTVTGENRPALIISERSAGCDGDFVAAAMTMTKWQLRQLLEEN